MYQSNHLPMTSQQSRRKSQASVNNVVNQQIDPLSINYAGPNVGGMTFQGQNFIGGMSDTGAAPDNGMVLMGSGPGSAGSSLAQYPGNGRVMNFQN